MAALSRRFFVCALLACASCTPMPTDGNVTTEVVSELPPELIGRTVTIANDVELLESDIAFLLDEDEIFGDREVLIVSASGQPLLAVTDAMEVQVTGEVQRFDRVALEAQYPVSLPVEVFERFQGGPVILAESAVRSPDPGDITRNPEAFYGQSLAVRGEVEERLGGQMLTLDENKLLEAEDLLVVATAPLPPLEDDQNITATGSVRPFDAQALVDEYNLPWDPVLQAQLADAYGQKPVLVAEHIFTDAD